MKSIISLVICISSISLLVNCAGNESKRAKTPTAPICDSSLSDCNGPTVNPTNPNFEGSRIFQSANMNVYNNDQFEAFLRSAYGSCDIPQVYITNNIWETLLVSGLLSAGNRCSKWNDNGFLELSVDDNGKAHLRFDVRSSFLGGAFSKNLIFQNIDLYPIKNNTALEADLGSGSQQNHYQHGITVEVKGDLNSNNLTVFIDYLGEEIVNFNVNRVQ